MFLHSISDLNIRYRFDEIVFNTQRTHRPDERIVNKSQIVPRRQ